MLEKTKGATKNEPDPETLVTLGTSECERIHTINNNKIQHRKIKNRATQAPPKTGGNLICHP